MDFTKALAAPFYDSINEQEYKFTILTMRDLVEGSALLRRIENQILEESITDKKELERIKSNLVITSSLLTGWLRFTAQGRITAIFLSLKHNYPDLEWDDILDFSGISDELVDKILDIPIEKNADEIFKEKFGVDPAELAAKNADGTIDEDKKKVLKTE